MKISRRGVLAGAAAGGGLAIAYVLLPQRFDAPLAPAEGEVGFNAWLKIATDGVVTVAVPQCEMGQGVTTLIPQIVAMELGADWRRALIPTPRSRAIGHSCGWRAVRISPAIQNRCSRAGLPSVRALPPPLPGPRWPHTSAPHARLRPPHAPC